jgi:prophage regulatory protein
MQGQQAQARTRILRRPEVEIRTGLSRSAIYALMARKEFPSAIPLTAKAVGWLESSIESWIESRAAMAAEQ